MSNTNGRLELDTIQGTDDIIASITTGYSSNMTKIDDAITAISNPNLLINGDFRINQRGASSYESGSGAVYTVDRWVVVRPSDSTGGLTIPQANNIVRIQREQNNSNLGIIVFGQGLETNIVSFLRNKQITLSCKMRKSATSSSDSVRMRFGFHNSSEINPDNPVTSSSDKTITLTNDFQIFTHTVLVPNDSVGLVVSCGYSGLTGTAGANDYIEISEAKLEIGSEATTFYPKLQSVELADCQRYYQIVPFSGVAHTTSQLNTLGGQYKTELRVAPSSIGIRSGTDGSGVDNLIDRFGSGGIAITYTAMSFNSRSVGWLNVTSNNLVVGDFYDGSFLLNAEI